MTLATLGRWLVRLVPVGGVILGWLAGAWLGAVIGLIAGCIAALALWTVGIYVAICVRLRRYDRDISKIMMDHLRRMESDTSAPTRNSRPPNPGGELSTDALPSSRSSPS